MFYPSYLALTSLWSLFLVAAAASELTVRNLPGRSAADTIREIGRNLHLGRRADTDVIFDKSTVLDNSFNDLTLFKFSKSVSKESGSSTKEATSEITIVCKTCYIKGQARAKLTASTSFNISQVSSTVQQSFNNTFQQIESYIVDVADEFKNSSLNIDNFIKNHDGNDSNDVETHGFQIPSPNIDFNVDVVDFPDTVLEVEFVDAEIYVELGITLTEGVTYTLNLYSSKELGVQVEDVFAGAVVNIDLILSVEAGIEIDTGFHIKLDDKVLMRLTMFAKEASHLAFNGGQFEFLPVTVQTTSVVFKAILRVGVRAGFSLGLGFDLGSSIEILDKKLDEFKVSAGIEASAYANVAEFITNITAAANDKSLLADGKDKDKLTCDFHIEQGYQLVVGAAAGASVALLGYTFGPVPETEIPIFYTTLSTGCAASVTAKPTVSATAKKLLVRDADMETTSTVIGRQYSAMACASPGLINCPASLLTPTITQEKKTLISIVPSGSSAVWPTGNLTVFNAISFGKDAMTMTASSGKPVSYVPPPPPTPTSTSSPGSDIGAFANKKTGGVSNKVIIGVSVGLGVPVIAALVIGLLFLRTRRQRKEQDAAASYPFLGQTDDHTKASTLVVNVAAKDGQ